MIPLSISALTRCWRSALFASVLGGGLFCPAIVSRGAPADVKLAPVPATVAQYDFLELVLEVEQPDFPNPFADVDVRGEFTLGSQMIPVEGFCDAADGSVYRVRFMPSEQGDYVFRITLSAGQYVATHAGAFRVMNNSAPGPVRVDTEHPFHFIRQGTGTHWFWNGTTAYQLLAWDDATIVSALDRLNSLGVNRVRIALAARTKNGDRWMEPLVQPTDHFVFKVEPWIAAHPGDIENPGYDVARFNLPMFQKADRLLRAARDRDIVISLIFYLDGCDRGVDPFGKQQAGSADEQRYYRYALARFAAFANVMWDVTNEWHLFRDEAWVNRIGGLIHSHDPYDLLTSVHGEAAFPFRKQPWADFALYQCWDEHGGYDFMLKNRHEQAAAGRPIPQINEEYGYEGHYPPHPISKR